MKGLCLEYKCRIMECGIKYVIWILLVLQMIIGFFGFGTGGAVLSALLVIQINDTMIVISIVMVLVSYIGSVLMWKYRKS